MSWYPWKVGDLVEVMPEIISNAGNIPNAQGIIVDLKDYDRGYFHVLIDGEIKMISKYLIKTPKITSVKTSGGLK